MDLSSVFIIDKKHNEVIFHGPDTLAMRAYEAERVAMIRLVW